MTEEIIELKKRVEESEEERARIGRELDDVKMEREHEKEEMRN